MGNELPSFPLYASDFLVAVSTWPPERVGAYWLALLHQWEHAGVPADDTSELALVLHATPVKARHLWATIAHKFECGADGLYRNGRLEEERETARQKVAGASKRGKAGARARWHAKRNTKRDAQALPDGSESDSNQNQNQNQDPVPTAPPRRRDFPQAVENLPSPSWKQALAIAHKVIQADPDDSANWTEAFKAKCVAEGLNPYAVGGDEDPRPLYARAVDAVEAQRRKRRAS